VKRHFPKLVLIFFLASAVLACVFVPSLNAFAKQVFAMFASEDFEAVRNTIAAYGAYAAGVSFALMVFQSVVAPLPAFLITFANASIFGWKLGALLSWTSAMAGAVLCFFIARILGRETAENLTSKAGLGEVDRFFASYGKHAILIARLLPFISFDIVSYAAGLTSMKFWPFFAATGIGQLPATLVYSCVGGMLTGGARFMVTALLILFALSVLIVLLRQIWIARESDNSAILTEKSDETR
jgi:uncharacterized membrane protein YdjX (TVP38/TMEM64 family)